MRAVGKLVLESGTVMLGAEFVNPGMLQNQELENIVGICRDLCSRPGFV